MRSGSAKAPRKLTEGMEFDVDVLEWFEEAWKDGHPVVILRPVYREYETTGLENAIEDMLLDACFVEELRDHEPPQRWNIRTLRERFRAEKRARESVLPPYVHRFTPSR